MIGFIYPQSSSLSSQEGTKEYRTFSSPFQDITLGAKSALVLNPVNGEVLFAKNEHEPLPLASIAKIMTAYVSHKVLADSQDITLTSYALEALGEYGFEIGDSWSKHDLTNATLVKSANDGARALAIESGKDFTRSFEETSQEKAFIDLMNRTAQELGFTSLSFENASGLDKGSQASALGSAEDVAQLFTYITGEDQSILEATTYDDFRARVGGANYRYVNTNSMINQIPNVIASKTGFTDLAGGNLGIVYDSGLNQPIVIVVLGSTREGRFRDVHRLIDATEAYLVEAGARDTI